LTVRDLKQMRIMRIVNKKMYKKAHKRCNRDLNVFLWGMNFSDNYFFPLFFYFAFITKLLQH
jgi:hypothetical protein